jgi:hypothetical protein
METPDRAIGQGFLYPQESDDTQDNLVSSLVSSQFLRVPGQFAATKVVDR